MSDVGDNTKPLVREWYKAKEALDKAKEHEMDLRKQVQEAVFGEPKKGTQKANLSNDAELVLSQSAKISVDKDEFLKHKAHLEKKGLVGENGAIKLKPEVSMTAYKYMSDEDKAAFDSVFKHGFASPTLEVRTKKG